MAIEKIFTVNNWNIGSVSWSGYFNTIFDLGITQIKIYFKLTASTEWTEIEKGSYSSTYFASSNSVSLQAATVNVDGSSVPAGLNSTQHEIKVIRSTSRTPYIEFKNGAKLDATDINTVGRQALHRIEEEASRLDDSDTAIYAYVDNEFTFYYTKLEIDNFFNTQTVPNWANGVSYVVGDTVLYNDPNTAASTILVWYATVDHIAVTGVNEPSSTGTGPSFWTLIAPDSSLANLSFIRKIPGIITTENNWNTISPDNVNATGLAFKPMTNQVASMLDVYKQDGTTKALSLISGAGVLPTNADRLDLSGAMLVVQDESWFSYDTNKSSFFNFDTLSNPTLTNPDGGGAAANPVIAIKQRVNQDAIQVYGANNALKFRVSGNGKMVMLGGALFSSTSVFDDHLVSFAGSEGHVGTHVSTSNFPVLSAKDFIWGLPSGGVADPFTAKATLTADTGTLALAGDLTSANVTVSSMVQAANLKTTGVVNSDFLKTDANGNVIAGSGTPTLSRSVVVVEDSDTALSNGDVVYLKNTNGKWTLAQANNKETLAFGVVDDVAANGSNQNFNVVVTGSVTNSGWNLDSTNGADIGNWAWLDKTTPGGITTTFPGTAAGLDFVDPVGVLVGADTLFIVPARPHQTPQTGLANSVGGGSIAGASDSVITSASSGEFLKWNGSKWINEDVPVKDVVAGTNMLRSENNGTITLANTLVVGTTAGKVCAGDDTRLSDPRTPTAHTHAQSEVTGLVTALASKAATNHSHTASQLTGDMPDARIVASNVTQHAAQIDVGDLGNVTQAGGLLGAGSGLYWNGSAWAAGALQATSVPSLAASKITSGELSIARGGTGSATAPMVGVITAADAAAAQSVLGLGTAATLDVGTTADKVVQMTATGKLPAVNGSLLTDLPASAATVSYVSSAPSNPAVGDLWFNSTEGVFSMWVSDGTTNQWVGISGATGATGPTGPAPTLSYTGHIEVAAVKEYVLDPFVAADRTITGFYITCSTGTATAILKHTPNSGTTVNVVTASVSNTSGAQTGLLNTTLVADSNLTLEVTVNGGAENVTFSMEYTS